MEARLDLEHDVILIESGEHGRDDALTEGIVQGVVDRRGQDAEGRRDLAIHRYIEHRPGIGLVAGSVGDCVKRLELFEVDCRPMGEFVRVRVRERVLILGFRKPRADRDILCGLHIKRNALDIGRVGV